MQTTPTDYAPGQKPGPRFTRALRRAATDPACVRDERGTVWRATTHEAHRVDVARYATRQQVARTKALQARAAAADAVKDAQRAYDAVKDGPDKGERVRALGALRHAEHALAWLVAEPLPEVPRVPPAGKPVEVPYLGGDALVTNRQAARPAGMRAEHRRTYPDGMPADVAERLGARARRCAAREATVAFRRVCTGRLTRARRREMVAAAWRAIDAAVG